ncbi:MFS transporter [Rhodococcus globerulus]|uniref:MFS transporter n=1 Tax=Rhodococcus globerulus TaxID=33008 RepID=UPI0039E7D7BD
MTRTVSDPATEVTENARVPSTVWVLSFIAVASGLGYGMLGPALPALADLYSVGAASVSLAVSGLAAGRLIANVSMTGLLKKFRLRNVLVFGLAIQGVCSVVAGLSPNFELFVAFRSLSGIGSAGFTVAGTGLLLVVTTSVQRARSMSIYFTATSLGMISGPAIGGLVATIDPRLPLIIYGVLLGVGSLVALVALRSARGLRTSDGISPEDVVPVSTSSLLRELFRSRTFVAVMLLQFATGWVLYGVRTVVMPVRLDDLGFGVGVIGMLLTVAAVAQIAASSLGAVTGRLSLRTVTVTALALALVVTALFGELKALQLIVAAFVGLGLAHGLTSTTAPSLLGEVRGGASGLAVAAFWIAFDVGAILGPYTTGALLDTAGAPVAFLSSAGVLAAALIACLFVPRKPKLPSPIEPSPQVRTVNPPKTAHSSD